VTVPRSVRSPRPATGLAVSVRRIEGLQARSELRTGMPAEDGWWRCSDLLADPTLFDEWRTRLGAWLRERHGVAPVRTTAGYVMTWYLTVPAYVGALLLHHERRVPTLRPEELAFRLGGDRPHPDGMSLLGDSFYCLPSDADSASPSATVVPDEHALAAVLRARYIAHAARFVAAFGPRSPLGKRMLWAAATDALDNSLWRAGLQGGTAQTEGAGVADAALVLADRYAPLTSASTLRMTEGPDGHREWTRRRESCCFSYLLPGEPECATCPRVCPKS
jgi:hypothetical protein